MHGGAAAQADQEWIECQSLAEVGRTLATKALGFKASDVAPCARCRPEIGDDSPDF